MLSRVYRAFLEAGAAESTAREAAEELASYENRFAGIDRDLAVLKWMLGAVLAIAVTILFKVWS